MDGADLRGWEIGTGGDGPLLNLRGASFSGARMRGAKLRQVDLEARRFFVSRFGDGGDRWRTGAECEFRAGELTGAVLRGLDLADASFDGAVLPSDAVAAVPSGAPGPHAGRRAVPHRHFVTKSHYERPVASRGARRAFQLGEVGRLLPDGARIVSAAYDSTLRLWDAASGECLSVLRGHDAFGEILPPSPPTARASSPPPMTAPCASGTPRPANASACCAVTRIG